MYSWKNWAVVLFNSVRREQGSRGAGGQHPVEAVAIGVAQRGAVGVVRAARAIARAAHAVLLPGHIDDAEPSGGCVGDIEERGDGVSQTFVVSRAV